MKHRGQGPDFCHTDIRCRLLSPRHTRRSVVKPLASCIIVLRRLASSCIRKLAENTIRTSNQNKQFNKLPCVRYVPASHFIRTVHERTVIYQCKIYIHGLLGNWDLVYQTRALTPRVRTTCLNLSIIENRERDTLLACLLRQQQQSVKNPIDVSRHHPANQPLIPNKQFSRDGVHTYPEIICKCMNE